MNTENTENTENIQQDTIKTEENVKQNLTDTYKKQLISLLTTMELVQSNNNNTTLILKDPIKSYFLNENEINLEKEWEQSFFWQRLNLFAKENSENYYRASISTADLPPDLLPLQSNKFLIFILRVQYEAHKIIEEPITIAASSTNTVLLNPDFILEFENKLQPTKIYFSKEEYDNILQTLKKNLFNHIKSSINPLQQQMFSRLNEEIERIGEYYSHIIARAADPDSQKALLEEQKSLENEQIRKFHPDSIAIVATPEIIIALTVV